MISEPYFIIPNVLTEEQCDYIRVMIGNPKKDAALGLNHRFDKSKRRTKINWITHLDDKIPTGKEKEYHV